ncbi:substrate-binding domain-containing protein [Dokdonella sp.]|uniref:substrate-binding domain-containing protein n=1 Tax=Dokdonella sp. TaxID=2291710 RepID=UPI0027B9B358|nr:substrate-binding domain-containing protein [Dokdonella sp.]
MKAIVLRGCLWAAAVLMFVHGAGVAAADQLVWRGDHATGRAIMDDLAKEYARQKLGTISLQPFSTLSGLDAVAQGSADFATSARGKYARRTEETGLDFTPVVLDGAVLITHPQNPVRSLTLKQIHDIYFGRITNWQDVGGPDKPINLYSIASPLDGVEYSLRALVYRNGNQPVAAPRLYINTAKLEEAITLDPAGLGLSTLANTRGNTKVRALAIEGVSASTQSVADGSYPLFITLYMVTRADSPHHDAVGRFAAFLQTPAAKAILRKHDLIPYADAGDVVARDQARMALIDERIGRETVAASAAAPADSQPMSAPRAVLAAKVATAPAADSTEAARANLARAEAAKAQQQAEPPAAKPAPRDKAAAKPKPRSSGGK